MVLVRATRATVIHDLAEFFSDLVATIAELKVVGTEVAAWEVDLLGTAAEVVAESMVAMVVAAALVVMAAGPLAVMVVAASEVAAIVVVMAAEPLGVTVAAAAVVAALEVAA